MNALAAALRAEADGHEAIARAKRLQADAIEHAAPEQVDERVFLTIDEAARHFDVSRRTVAQWLADGCPSLKRGRVRRVPVAAATAWLEARRAS